MRKITIADVLNNSLSETGWETYHLYVIRDGDLTLYVGKTEQNVIDRLEEHLGLTYRAPSQVGKLVEDNAPASHNWCIDLRTVADCTLSIQRQFRACKTLDMDIAEKALIKEFSPPLNGTHNSNAHPLPEVYQRGRLQRIKDVHRRLFD